MTFEEIADSLLEGSKSSGCPFYEKYEPYEILGRGLCSVVRKCVEKTTKTPYAVKIIDLTRKDNLQATEQREAGYNEIRLLKQCSDHPYIITLHEAFETPAFLFLVFELCPNGELFDLLTQKVRLSEKRARVIMRQLLESIAFLHSKGIMHRDIKCENILLSDSCDIRLSDFGFATVYDKNVIYKELLGTPGYLSPEMLKANSYENQPSYGLAIDMWACGVVLYTLIAGSPPFYNRKTIYMLRDIMNGKYTFSGAEWEDVSSECKELVERMLCVDPTKRITAHEALQQRFLQSTDTVQIRTAVSRVKSVFHAIRAIIRMRRLSRTPQPICKQTLSTKPYKHKALRKLIDSSAYNLYGHWVQRTDEQNRAALFQCFLKPHQAPSLKRRHRLLSDSQLTSQ
ncbi:phosphorylase b kinase gamma catalytic chain, liver/testis isoform-like [Watersipora subatra]|uniref:phosphorylase b kinase gamma catalytic chain, liver/testis isoform-like n=1 Tax=Watersipora subatra TaxID=2589382 RepID=UPI00355C33E3